eukprot:105336_1
MSLFWKQNKGYVLILINGIILFTIFGSIYSFLTTVDAIRIRKISQFNFLYEIDFYDGFSCYAGELKSEYCNNVAFIYAEQNGIGVCESKFDSSTKLYEETPLFYVCFAAMIICLALVSIFSVLHDWRLIYLVKSGMKLKNIRWYPEENMHFLFFTVLLFKLWDPCVGNLILSTENKTKSKQKPNCFSQCKKIKKCFVGIFEIFSCLFSVIRMMLLVFGLLITFILDIVLCGFIVPVIFGPFVCFKQKYQCIECQCGAAYVSSCYVGLMRIMVSVFSMILIWVGFTGFAVSQAVSSIYDPEQVCKCSCSYVFKSANFVALLGMCVVVLAKNGSFLISWSRHGSYQHQHLYLKRYSLPVSVAYKINKENPAGDMFVKMDNNNEKQHKRSINSELHWDGELIEIMRKTIVGGIVCITGASLFGCIIMFIYTNPYEWNKTYILCLWALIFLPFCMPLFMYVVGRCQLKSEVKDNEALDPLMENSEPEIKREPYLIALDL